MSFELLWTDQCFLALVVVVGAWVAFSARKEHVKRSFSQLLNNPIASSTAIILMFFLSIAVLDSIHIKTQEAYQANSLLDRLLSPVGDTFEKTYSAPLSLTLYVTETTYENGDATQTYPRLQYPPVWLKNNQDVGWLVGKVVLLSLVFALILSTGIFFGWRFIKELGARPLSLNERSTAKSLKTFSAPAITSAFLTLFVCLTVLIATFWLSRYLHVFGTGKIGQDVLYYAIKSIRTGMIIGTLTTLFMLPLALMLGLAAGYFGGFIDDAIQYLYTTLSSIPGVLLITAAILSMQTYISNHPQEFATLAQNADARLLALCFILGITSWTSLCRLLRAETLKLREIDFVLAAEALGSSSTKILLKHLLPNVMHIVLITLVLDFSFLVLAEAVLSYVGVGVSPLTISWGNMINAARLELAREPIVWWPVLAAFIFMFVLVLASNLFADTVRDAFDPRQSTY